MEWLSLSLVVCSFVLMFDKDSLSFYRGAFLLIVFLVSTLGLNSIQSEQLALLILIIFLIMFILFIGIKVGVVKRDNQ